MSKSSFRFRWISLTVIVVLVVAAIAWILLGKFSSTKSHPLSKEVNSPAAALSQLSDKPLYFNTVARDWLKKLKPKLLEKEDKNPQSERARDFAKAESNPHFWRKLDRKYRFSAVLIIGDPGAASPLVDHLLSSPDWTLTYLDQTSLIFKRRPAKAWKNQDFSAIEKKFAKKPDWERAQFYNLAADKLLGIHHLNLAKHCLDAALHCNSHNAVTWTQMATYNAQISRWSEALHDANKALANDESYRPALLSKTQILYTMGKFDDAYAMSSRLAKAAPDDIAIQTLYAKIAHADHAFENEIKTLLHLIGVLEKAHLPTTTQRVYLGQAYARIGKAVPAIKQLKMALSDPALSGKSRKNVQKVLDQIKTR